MTSSEAQLPTIVIVDDDEGHCELIRRNFSRQGISNPIAVYNDGASALAFLQDPDRHDPLLVLLDINMPGALNGVELLEQLKKDGEHRATPIFMLTTTDDPREIKRCYDAGCSAYVTKPVDITAFKEVIKRLGLFIGILRVDQP
jgi:CheY-like chemotaxis protein